MQAGFRSASRPGRAERQFTAARQYSTAERDLWMPTVSALAAVGGTPVRADQIQSSWYGAAGANISIPVFNGFLFNARAQEAKAARQGGQENVRNLRDVIARDVRTAVLNAQNAFQRIAVTQQMLNRPTSRSIWPQARYKIGLSGIVELTQAQLHRPRPRSPMPMPATPIKPRWRWSGSRQASSLVEFAMPSSAWLDSPLYRTVSISP